MEIASDHFTDDIKNICPKKCYKKNFVIDKGKIFCEKWSAYLEQTVGGNTYLLEGCKVKK